MSVIIEIDNLINDIFNNLSMKIDNNKIYSISGSNNSGKTTLIRTLSTNNNDYIKVCNYKVKEFKLDEYNKIVQTVIPLEFLQVENTLEDEFIYYNNDEELINFLKKGLSLNRIIDKNYNNLSNQDKIIYQIAVSLVKKPLILLLDNIGLYFTNKELIDLYDFFKEFINTYGLTILSTTINLEESLLSDYLYIINNGNVALEGLPLEVIKKDNIINKLGLSIPFMVDLSVKLCDYELIDEIILDKERMVEKLWK